LSIWTGTCGWFRDTDPVTRADPGRQFTPPRNRAIVEILACRDVRGVYFRPLSPPERYSRCRRASAPDAFASATRGHVRTCRARELETEHEYGPPLRQSPYTDVRPSTVAVRSRRALGPTARRRRRSRRRPGAVGCRENRPDRAAARSSNLNVFLRVHLPTTDNVRPRPKGGIVASREGGRPAPDEAVGRSPRGAR